MDETVGIIIEEPLLTEAEKLRIEKEAEKKALLDTATENPKAMVGLLITQKQTELINEDEVIKERIKEVAGENVDTVIEEHKGDNRKTQSESYIKGRENAIKAMGENSNSPKSKQKFVLILYDIAWYILTVLISPVLAPLAVIWNKVKIFAGTKVTVTESDKITTYEKLNKGGTLLAVILSIIYLTLFIFCGISIIRWIGSWFA